MVFLFYFLFFFPEPHSDSKFCGRECQNMSVNIEPINPKVVSMRGSLPVQSVHLKEFKVTIESNNSNKN